MEEVHLLDSGRRLKKLNFSKAPWPEIKTELTQLDWQPMEKLAKESPVSAHAWFLDKLIPILEKLVPLKKPKKKGINRMARKGNLLWRKLSKIQLKIQSSSSLPKLTKLIQDKWDIEQQLKSEYSSLNKKDEEQALLNMKTNPKSFFSFAKTRQKTRARIGPFIGPSLGSPNPDPDFAASVLSDQYQSVFVQPRPEWLVDDAEEFFTHSGGDEPSIVDIDFSESDIEAACSELSSSSAAGADGVPSSLLKVCRKELKRP